MADPRVVDNKDASRYELFEGDRRIGFADYRLAEGSILFTYIEIEPALQGRGLATTLTEAALNDARLRELEISARCPFIVDYLDQHPEYVTPR
jgi:predicted GNAT family acetyltransferase